MMNINNLKKILNDFKVLSGFDVSVNIDGNCFISAKNESNIFIEKETENYLIKVFGDDEKANITLSLLGVTLDNFFNFSNNNKLIENILYKKIDEEFLKKYINKNNLDNYSYYLFLIKSNNKSYEIDENTNSVFDIDYSLVIDNNLLLLISKNNIGEDLLDFINSELMYFVNIGYSNKTVNLLSLEIAYNQAKNALDLVYVFGKDKLLYGYGNNSIDMLIKSFNKEQINSLLENYDISNLNHEDITTINAFINCDLNIAQASRYLYLHRNTLIYRIEKINKIIDLDIRKFDDAMLLRILLLFKNN